ncbi:hypothetical protein HPP92_026467 [Vanilla planifolia]|uniref:Uncharacterized protein n=1 Tax=Vanilla planifolia TaxID=51239 RepID=A0A835PC74_VANPL|nr:hypothetical protein HPP92_026690 [Vanilla planifolia]KAG0450996.1 hypothetical protein HPP92_026467 [Vanilla planifolia]
MKKKPVARKVEDEVATWQEARKVAELGKREAVAGGALLDVPVDEVGNGQQRRGVGEYAARKWRRLRIDKGGRGKGGEVSLGMQGGEWNDVHARKENKAVDSGGAPP